MSARDAQEFGNTHKSNLNPIIIVGRYSSVSSVCGECGERGEFVSLNVKSPPCWQKNPAYLDK